MGYRSQGERIQEQLDMQLHQTTSRSTEDYSGPGAPQLLQLFRFRSLCLLAFTLFLLTGPVPEQTDLVAAVLGFSLLSLIVLNVCTTVVFGFLLRRSSAVRLFHQPKHPSNTLAGGEFYAGEKVHVTVAIRDGLLPPFYVLRITPIFDREVAINTFQVSGSIASERYISQGISFPHRGVWNVLGFRIQLEDQLGLSRFGWDSLLEPSSSAPLISHPPFIHHLDVPVMSSEMQSGDVQTDLAERKGDPFDLKRYHPSDGMKRILWKVYAKSGELISRYPERALVPEGDLFMYVIATRSEDYVAGGAVAYVRTLEREQIRVRVNCDGSAEEFRVASSPEQVEELLIQSVWNAGHFSVEQASAEIQRIWSNSSQRSATVGAHKLLLFLSLSTVGSPMGSSFLLELANRLQTQGISPCFVAVRKRRLSTSDKQDVEPEEQFSDERVSLFHGVCVRNGWPFIITEIGSSGL